ncbi:MAG TPA: peptidoglycan DD-metalloendopeptidase family protein [Kofleriaceae bacterium]
MTIAAVKPGATAPVKEDAAKTAGKQLEAFFLRQLLSEAQPQGTDGGFAGDTFKQMFNEAVADKMASAGGIGLADVFSKQLEKQAGGSASATSPASPEVAHAGLPMPSHDLGPSVDGLPRLVMPVAGRASSGYGERFDPIQHKEIKHPGFDLAAPTGTTVDAAASGTVTHAGPAGTYGNLIIIKHADGVETRYAHLSATSVKEGDHVDAGQPIGAVGTTGYSTGPHLHFEVRKDGKPIDPAPLLPINTPIARPKT